MYYLRLTTDFDAAPSNIVGDVEMQTIPLPGDHVAMSADENPRDLVMYEVVRRFFVVDFRDGHQVKTDLQKVVLQVTPIHIGAENRAGFNFAAVG